jgi:hypothetical protein
VVVNFEGVRGQPRISERDDQDEDFEYMHDMGVAFDLIREVGNR